MIMAPENYKNFIWCLKFLCCNFKDEAARLRMISNKEARAAKRAAQAEKRRQEVEKRRREREEQLKREKEEFERQQNLKAELEEERKRADEARRYIPYIGNFSRGFNFRWVRKLPEIAKNRHSEK